MAGIGYEGGPESSHVGCRRVREVMETESWATRTMSSLSSALRIQKRVPRTVQS